MFAADVLIDAILGTGFRPPVSELYAAAIAALNASKAPVVAIDIPSGVDADALGEQTGVIARAERSRNLYRSASGPYSWNGGGWSNFDLSDRLAR